MTNTFINADVRGQRSGVLPPWLWFWLAIYIVGFPTIFDRIKTNLLIIFSGRSDIDPLVLYNIFARAPSVVEILLDLTLTIGVLTVFLPWIRTSFLRKRYGLTEPQFLSAATTAPETWQALNEVNGFIRQYAAGLVLTYNASGKRLPDQALVYPIGYRGAGLAISGKLLQQWDSDRPGAEAILLHEIEHYRHGDILIVGAGSLLETIIKRWFLLTALFVIVPLVLSVVIEHVTSFEDIKLVSATSDMPKNILYQVQQVFVLDIPAILLILLASFFWAASLFTLAIIAIWSAEINADRFAVDTTQSGQALVKVIEQHTLPPSLWRRLWSGVYHPPAVLRQWFVRRSESTRGLTLLLLFFPIAWFVRLLFLLGWALSQYLLFLYTGTSMDYIIAKLGINVMYGLEAFLPTWLGIAVLIALWPRLTGGWERIFNRDIGRPAILRSPAYVSSTAFVALICLISLVLSLLPAPKETAGLTPVAPVSVSKHTSSGHFQVGETAKIGDLWIVSISQVQAKPRNSFLSASGGHVFLTIAVSLQNISGQTSYFSSSQGFKLRDLQGNEYPDTYISPVPPPEVKYNGNIPANTIARGQLTYEIPDSVSRFTLTFNPDWRKYNPQTSKFPVWDITANATTTVTGDSGAPTIPPTPTLPAPSPTPGAATTSYPTLQQRYQGTLVNTTDNSNTRASSTLSSIVQDQAGHISGRMDVQLPLAGSGPLTGTVSSSGAIQFSVVPDDGSGYTSIVFTGTMRPDGSMSGVYTLPGTSQGGKWQFSPQAPG
ncbi:MAG: hypothetical protein NVSMB44_32620 [Ktedonobacteraceae bacterium]